MCAATAFGICFNPAVSPAQVTIFGFSEFLASLALLVLVYLQSSFIYKFRVAITKFNFQKIAFFIIVFSGAGTLLTDVWIDQSWYAPALGIPHVILQLIFAILFLTTVMSWLYFAFVNPPLFGVSNAERYVAFVFRTVMNGSDSDVTEVVREISRSAERIISFASVEPERGGVESRETGSAIDLLSLLSNRRVAREIALSSPLTLINLARAMREMQRVPRGGSQLVNAAIEEALVSKKSILFHETREYGEDLIRMARPLLSSVLADFEFFEALGNRGPSPLDIDWSTFSSFDGEQFEAYCLVVAFVFKSYVATCRFEHHSYGLHRAFDNIKMAGMNLHSLNTQDPLAWRSDDLAKLRAAVRFVADALSVLDECTSFRISKLRRRERDHNRDIVDQLVEIAKQLIFDAASIGEPPEFAWHVHYSKVWGQLFSLRTPGAASKAFRFKLFRSLYDEIKEMETFPNFKGARILGYLLNIFGMEVPDRKSSYRLSERPLAIAVRSWAQKNYLPIWRSNRRVAEACIFGAISYREHDQTLIKTYALGTEDKPQTSELKLRSEH